MTEDIGMLKIKPSDAKSWISCGRRVWIDNRAELQIAPKEDFFELLIIDLGIQHEQAVLERLSRTLTVHKARSPEDTRRLIQEGVQVIYQAQLVDEENGLVGFPDFLIRNNDGEYQAADAKLSLNAENKDIQIQLGVYRHLLNRMLGSELPAIVFLGNGEQALVGDEANTITDKFVTEMRALLESEDEPLVHYSHSKCRDCPYYTHCKPVFEAKEDLSLLYGIQGRAADGLVGAGINTISQLASTDPVTIPDVPYIKGKEKKQRAVLQAKSYQTGEVFQIGSISLPQGHWVHFDIEDNPLTGTSDKHVYLWGFLVPDAQGNWDEENFEYVWTDSTDEDEYGWLQFLAQIERYRQQYPQLILAHYSSHEESTIRSYANRYGMQDNETVTYLLGVHSPLYDMRKPILDNLVLPLQGYGLKDICKHPDLVNFQWQDDDSGSQWSVVQFNRYLAEVDPATRTRLKAEILSYNRDDVTATRRLEQWLNYMII